jgi:hypothetical protein
MTATEITTAGRAGAPPQPRTFAGMLDAVHREVADAGHLVSSPDGVILASPAALAAAPLTRITRNGRRLSVPHTGPPQGQPFARFGGGIAIVPPDHRRQAGQPAGTEATAFACGLLSAQSELLRGTLDLAMRHLDARSSGGVSLLTKPQMQALLGDAAAEIAAAASLASALASDNPPPGPVIAGCWRTSRRLRASGRSVLRALGASGFLTTSAASDILLAEIACALYLCPHPATECNGE